jgi:hypothetical protein
MGSRRPSGTHRREIHDLVEAHEIKSMNCISATGRILTESADGRADDGRLEIGVDHAHGPKWSSMPRSPRRRQP